MKKMFRFAGLCGAAIALLLALGMNLSVYAAEMPAQTEASVTLNSQPADVYAEMIDGKLYFSLRDYWVNIQRLSPERVKWFGDVQAVSDGNLFLFLKDQTCQGYFSAEALPLTEPAILKGGRVLVTPAFLLQDSHFPVINRKILLVPGENTLDFRMTFWEGNPQLPDYYTLIPLDAETGFPDFENNMPWPDTVLNPEDFNIVKTEAEDGTQIFTYVSKTDAEKILTATVWDGYVTHIKEQNAVFPISVRN